MSDWQPISTAPRDGAEFLAFDGSMVEVVKFDPDGILRVSCNLDRFSMDAAVSCDATHWMPIPQPPEDAR